MNIVPKIRSRADKHTERDTHTDRHAHHNTSLPYRGRSNYPHQRCGDWLLLRLSATVSTAHGGGGGGGGAGPTSWAGVTGR